ncbi:hypothetical protein MNBD_ALPHA06-667 [hydrothermal vent metagenome]|uniref:TNase-like domain-containing protein n=1 Tax=hydrothermal vent metagenome TaxID=652676 RepID=A0A3B0RRB7_9ZZZZ
MIGISRRQFAIGTGALFAGCTLLPWQASGQDLLAEFVANGRVLDVLSGDRFVLEDGRKVRLAGIEAPRMAFADAAAQPLFATAKTYLQNLLIGKEVIFSDPAPDRFGRLRAHVLLQDGQIWVQGQMLAQGLARVRTWNDDQKRAGEMLALENTARSQKTGIWARGFYAVRSPDAVRAATGSYQIIAGEVVDASQSKKMIYLNFGSDWRRDFTAQTTKKTAKIFAKSGIVLAGLSGANIRVRGTIKYNNGPMLWLNHPAQLEILENS